MRSCVVFATMTGILSMLVSSSVVGQTALNPDESDLPASEKIYSPYVERTVRNKDFVEGVYWGDTHLHTRYSSDAGMIGNKLGPD